MREDIECVWSKKLLILYKESRKYSGNHRSAADIVSFGQGRMERSKTFVVPKKYRDFAKQDALAMRNELSGGGKHNPSNIIRDKQKMFPKGLEWMRVKVGNDLEWEDWIFLKHHYKVALSNYLAANRIDLENVSNEVMQRARYRAMQEAQRNTYRDLSEFANAISKFSKKNMATAILAEGLMPFKKTPINVLKRGVEYSPVAEDLSRYLLPAKKLRCYKVSFSIQRPIKL